MADSVCRQHLYHVKEQVVFKHGEGLFSPHTMRVILQSNIAHYHHLAQALYSAGKLERYITSNLLVGDEPALSLLPKYWRDKLEGRRLRDVPRERITEIRIAELMQRLLPATKLFSPDTGNLINNHLFDFIAAQSLDDCDVFHFINSLGLYSARKAQSRGAKTVCDVRQEHPFFQERILSEEARRQNVKVEIPGKPYEQRMIDEFELADFFVVPSMHAKDTFVAEGYDARSISVIPYGTDLRYFHQKPRTDAVFRVICVGSITLRKGIHYLLQAFKELNLPNAELLLIGNVDFRFKPLLAKYEGVFRHLAAIPKIALIDYYSNSSVFVLPSLADSFALVVLEAMACGIPAIVTTNTGAGEAIEDGKTGFIVPIRDVEVLKEKILFLYQNPDVNCDMGARAMNTAHRMTWESYERRVVDFYESVEISTQLKSPVKRGNELIAAEKSC